MNRSEELIKGACTEISDWWKSFHVPFEFRADEFGPYKNSPRDVTTASLFLNPSGKKEFHIMTVEGRNQEHSWDMLAQYFIKRGIEAVYEEQAKEARGITKRHIQYSYTVEPSDYMPLLPSEMFFLEKTQEND